MLLHVDVGHGALQHAGIYRSLFLFSFFFGGGHLPPCEAVLIRCQNRNSKVTEFLKI